MSSSITRRAFLGAAFLFSTSAILVSTGCGYPSHIDPPLYERDVTPLQLAQEALLHAIDLPGGSGMHFQVSDTGSMEPVLKGGDHIVVAGRGNRPYASLKEGEIIVYWADWTGREEPPVVHRFGAEGPVWVDLERGRQ